MRLSDLLGKEIINVFDGARLGTVGDSDLVIDNETGDISAIVIPARGGWGGFWGDRQSLIIPWECVKKIGSQVIIVDLDQSKLKLRHLS